jgi:ABC-2 type transport system ATP-binding protein
MNVIEIRGLRKTYTRRKRTIAAVDSLDLEVPEGGVFGFLGPNGSGKTTTIRCLLGLARPTKGTLSILGRSVPKQLGDAVRNVGAIVETPALFPTMTARENLRLLARIDRIGPKRVNVCLDMVGLSDRADDLVKGYSLGMRQRLALGAAMLRDPELLVLDEPANGLDPSGMREVRDLLRLFAAEGRTVFVSSHILSEIEQTCDRVAILNHGRCIANGSVQQVIDEAGGAGTVALRTTDLESGRHILNSAGYSVARRGDELHVDVDANRSAEIARVLGQSDQWVTELRPLRPSLEDVFLELTGDSDDSADDPTTAINEDVAEEVLA